MKKVILFVSLVMVFAMAQAQSKSEGKKSEVTEYMFWYEYHVNNTTGSFDEEPVYVTLLDKPGEKPVIITSGVCEGSDDPITDELEGTVVFWKSKKIVYLYGKRWTYAFAEVDVAGLDKYILYLMKKDGSSDFSRVNKTDSNSPATGFCEEAIECLYKTISERSFHNLKVEVRE